MLKCLSVNNIVRAPANTGTDKTSKIDVTKIDHANKGMLTALNERICIKVTIKLIEPNNEDRPAICREPINKSTAAPGLYVKVDNGGYKVQPVPGP